MTKANAREVWTTCPRLLLESTRQGVSESQVQCHTTAPPGYLTDYRLRAYNNKQQDDHSPSITTNAYSSSRYTTAVDYYNIKIPFGAAGGGGGGVDDGLLGGFPVDWAKHRIVLASTGRPWYTPTSRRHYHHAVWTTGWWSGTVVERRLLTGKLSLSCARPAADAWPLTWVNHPLQVSQLDQLSLSSFLGR